MKFPYFCIQLKLKRSNNMKKIIGILLALLIIGGFGVEAKTTKKGGKKKSVVSTEVKNKGGNTISAIQGLTNFTVGSKVVKIPNLNSFQPLLKHFPKTSRKIKSIKICYMTGLAGEPGDYVDYFRKAKNFREAKKVSCTDILTFDFNKNQQIVKYIHYLGSDQFKYDTNGHLKSIIDEEWGYRGSPAYKVQYNIKWKDDTPISINRDIIEFESEYEELNDETLPFDLDFASDDVVSNLIAMLNSNTTKVKTQQNTCRISGRTIIENEFFSKGDNVVYWVEVQYY